MIKKRWLAVFLVLVLVASATLITFAKLHKPIKHLPDGLVVVSFTDPQTQSATDSLNNPPSGSEPPASETSNCYKCMNDISNRNLINLGGSGVKLEEQTAESLGSNCALSDLIKVDCLSGAKLNTQGDTIKGCGNILCDKGETIDSCPTDCSTIAAGGESGNEVPTAPESGSTTQTDSGIASQNIEKSGGKSSTNEVTEEDKIDGEKSRTVIDSRQSSPTEGLVGVCLPPDGKFAYILESSAVNLPRAESQTDCENAQFAPRTNDQQFVQSDDATSILLELIKKLFALRN